MPLARATTELAKSPGCAKDTPWGSTPDTRAQDGRRRVNTPPSPPCRAAGHGRREGRVGQDHIGRSYTHTHTHAPKRALKHALALTLTPTRLPCARSLMHALTPTHTHAQPLTDTHAPTHTCARHTHTLTKRSSASLISSHGCCTCVCDLLNPEQTPANFDIREPRSTFELH
jgi:hypothetical protein